VVEPTADGQVLLHAKDEIAKLKMQLKDYQMKEKEVVIATIYFYESCACSHLLGDSVA